MPFLALGAATALGIGGWMLWQGETAEAPAVAQAAIAIAVPAGPSTLRQAPAPPQTAWVPMCRQEAELAALLKSPARLYPELQAHPELARDPAAGLKLVGGWLTPTTTQVKLPLPSARNAGVRLKVKMSDPEKMDGASIWLRSVDGGGVYSGNWRGIIHNFGKSPKKPEYLAERKNLVPKKFGETFTLEFYTIGTQLICRYEGDVLRISEPAANRAPGTLNHLMIRNPVTDIEFIHLDGLSEAEALKLAGVSEPQPAAFPQGRWTRVLSTQAEVDAQPGLNGRLTLKPDGWLDFSVPKDAPGVGLTAFSAANAGVRVKLRIADKAPQPTVATLTLRHTTTPPPRQEGYRLQILSGGSANPSFSLAHYDGLTRKSNILNKHIRPGALKAGDEMSLEFYTIGSRLIGRVNGELLPIAEDKRLTRGVFTLQTGHLLRDIELIHLDGLSEAEALKLAGLGVAEDAAVTGTANPGRLRAAGTLRNGSAPDIAKFAAFDDFVDVAGGMDSWVALRANGEMVSSDGEADFQGIRKIARSYQGQACFIGKTGGLRFHPAREMAVPASLKGAKVADAACGSHHGVALLEDGRAVVFGRRYEEAMEDASQPQGMGTPRWPQPEPAALQNVKGVAVTYTHAATLHHDGTVSIWGWEGPVKWQSEPEMKPVRQISSFHDALHLLDEAGQVWSFPLPRSAHPQQPVGFKGRVKLLGTDAVRLRDHLWLDADGAWRAVEADLPTVEMVNSAPLKPETNFALYASASGAKPFGYVLWIEPGE